MEEIARGLGQTPTACLNAVRLENACQEIFGGRKSMTRVAMDRGSDESYFNRVFKRPYGVSPGQYQKTLKQRMF